MTPTKAVVFGAGGHAKVVLEIILEDPAIEVVGLLDPNEDKWGQRLFGIEILGGDNIAAKLRADGVSGFYLGLGSTGNLAPRKMVYDRAIAVGLKPLSVVHKSSIISNYASLRPGACVMAGVVVNAGARIGTNVCVNTAAVIEHDCSLGAHSFIGPGVHLGGGVAVGARAFVGIGATVRQAIKLGSGSLVGAGAVVVRNVLPKQVVVGVPARPIIRA